jgi:hypothetical protein
MESEPVVVDQLPADFDPDEYLACNPDLVVAGVDPVQHWFDHGRDEGRDYRGLPQALRARHSEPFHFDGLSTIHNHDFMIDPTFTAAYARGVEAAGGSDYQWFWRVHLGLWAASTALRVPGDFVECGVNRGFLASAIMQQHDWDSTGRTFWLLDTFQGLDEAELSDEERASGLMERNQRELDSGMYAAAPTEVVANFAEWSHHEIVVGSVPGTLDAITAEQVAYLHLDMNCSPPEVAALERLWPRMSTGGVVLLDDYAYHGYQTQKDGIDDWSRRTGVPVASLPTGQGLIVKN